MNITWRELIDLASVSLISYSLFRLTRMIRAFRIAAVLGFVYGAAIAARHLDLAITARVLEGWVFLGLALIAIVFQPEIRRALMKVDAFWFSPKRGTAAGDVAKLGIATAVFQLAKENTGALIVLLNRDSIDDFVDGGVTLNADVSAPLLYSIFQKGSPLHDGAVVIRASAILRAKVVLPLAEGTHIPIGFGTRHRAAMGIAERADVLAIVASEERGEVTAMAGHHGMVIRDQDELLWVLSSPLRPAHRSGFGTIAQWIVSDWKLKAVSMAFAVLILGSAAFLSGSSERILSASIEFDNLPKSVDVIPGGVSSVQVEVRGKSWLMDTAGLSGLTVHMDLAGHGAGIHAIKISPGNLTLPPGVRAIRVIPDSILVRIETRHRADTILSPTKSSQTGMAIAPPSP